jgi:tetratricopeptide (TPR) repeat protein
LIDECLAYDPDTVIVYTGHNEFLERRTYQGLFDQGRLVVTLRSLLERLYLFRGLRAVLEPLLDKPLDAGRASSPEPGSSRATTGKTIMKDEVTAILDRSAGLDWYHRDAEFAQGVTAHFAGNLNRTIDLCKRADVPLLLVEPAANLKDFSPFKSEHGPDVSKADEAAIQSALKRATVSLQNRSFAEAWHDLENLLNRDPLYARTQFLAGSSLWGLGRYEQAAERFTRARDLDVCPLRCPGALLSAMREVAGERSVPLISCSGVLKAQLEKSGNHPVVLGNESFLDHVHPTIEGHIALAQAILAEMVREDRIRVSRRLTPDHVSTIRQSVMEELDPGFFASRDLNLAKVLKWAGKDREARAAVSRALETLPQNPELHKILGGLLMKEEAFDQAIDAYQRAVELSNGDPPMVYSLAVAQHEAGRTREAIATYHSLVAARAELPDAYANLALIYFQEGDQDAGREVLEIGLEVTPAAPSVQAAYGLALALAGRPDQGIRWMQKALQGQPDEPSYLYNLAGMQALTGKRNAAMHTLELAVKAGYRDFDRLRDDPVFDGIRQDERFTRILRRD